MRAPFTSTKAYKTLNTHCYCEKSKFEWLLAIRCVLEKCIFSHGYLLEYFSEKAALYSNTVLRFFVSFAETPSGSRSLWQEMASVTREEEASGAWYRMRDPGLIVSSRFRGRSYCSQLMTYCILYVCSPHHSRRFLAFAATCHVDRQVFENFISLRQKNCGNKSKNYNPFEIHFPLTVDVSEKGHYENMRMAWTTKRCFRRNVFHKFISLFVASRLAKASKAVAGSIDEFEKVLKASKKTKIRDEETADGDGESETHCTDEQEAGEADGGEEV